MGILAVPQALSLATIPAHMKLEAPEVAASVSHLFHQVVQWQVELEDSRTTHAG